MANHETARAMLGREVQCKLTELRGVCTAYSENLNGAVQVCIEPPMTKEGVVPHERWIDVGRCMVLGAPLTP